MRNFDNIDTILRQDFLSIKDWRDLADYLEIEKSKLFYILFKLPSQSKYHEFTIPKKNGSTRNIHAPSKNLLQIQKKLAHVINHIYHYKDDASGNLIFTPHTATHGFIYKRSIITNASVHSKRNIVLNIDLKDFFPSITFARVRGVFLNKPFSFGTKVATVLSHLFLYKQNDIDFLPQGSPASPIISNLVCFRLDNQLTEFAKQYNCRYSRYADDITFSTNAKEFSSELVTIEGNEVVIGQSLNQIIISNGFTVNKNKVRLQHRFNRQSVTGLTVNEFPNVERKYIRLNRAILHAIEKYGIDKARNKFNQSDVGHSTIENTLLGRINFVGQVKGFTHPVYLSQRLKYNKLFGIKSEQEEFIDSLDAMNNKISEMDRIFSISDIDFSIIENKELVDNLNVLGTDLNKNRKDKKFIAYCDNGFLIFKELMAHWLEESDNSSMGTLRDEYLAYALLSKELSADYHQKLSAESIESWDESTKFNYFCHSNRKHISSIFETNDEYNKWKGNVNKIRLARNKRQHSNPKQAKKTKQFIDESPWSLVLSTIDSFVKFAAKSFSPITATTSTLSNPL